MRCKQPFILCARTRSGTNFFRSVINKHPEIYCHRELFEPIHYTREDNFHSYWLNALAQDPSFIVHDKMMWLLDQFLENTFSKSGKKAVGIDIKYLELMKLDYLRKKLQALKPKMIHIVRKNVLRNYISNFLLSFKYLPKNMKHFKKKGVLPGFDAIKRAGQTRVILEPGENLIVKLDEISREINSISEYLEAHFTTITLCYEQFFDHGKTDSSTLARSTLLQVYDFLNIENKSVLLSSDMKKVNPYNLHILIDNYKDVAKYLAQGPFSFCLNT